jgi:hypothetical protein
MDHSSQARDTVLIAITRKFDAIRRKYNVKEIHTSGNYP